MEGHYIKLLALETSEDSYWFTVRQVLSSDFRFCTTPGLNCKERKWKFTFVRCMSFSCMCIGYLEWVWSFVLIDVLYVFYDDRRKSRNNRVLLRWNLNQKQLNIFYVRGSKDFNREKSLGSLNFVEMSLCSSLRKIHELFKIRVRSKEENVNKRCCSCVHTMTRFKSRNTNYEGTHTDLCITVRLQKFF